MDTGTTPDLDNRESLQLSESTGSQGDSKVASPTFAQRLWRWSGIGEKSLVDLLQLVASTAAAVAIPIIGIVISDQQDRLSAANAQRQLDISADNQRHQILSNYLDQMTTLLLENKLDAANTNEQIRFIARARTLNTLPQLDGERKAQLLKFLYEAQLIGGQCQVDLATLEIQRCQESVLELQEARFDNAQFERPIPLQGIDLAAASLSGSRLVGIDLTQANMAGVILEKADLSQAILIDARIEQSLLDGVKLVDADLLRANLSSALLRSANLSGANLKGAVLTGVDLQGSNLNNANLEDADLRGANLSNASLEDAKLNGAIYNNSTNFPQGFDREGKGMRFQS